MNENAEVCEEFLGIQKLKKMDAQSVFDVLIPALKSEFTRTRKILSSHQQSSYRPSHQRKLSTLASMSQDRLSGLAMLMIHRGSEFIPSPHEVYEKKANWRVRNR